MIPETEYAWAAGWLEADGCFCLYLRKDREFGARPSINSGQAYTKKPLQRLLSTANSKAKIYPDNHHPNYHQVHITGYTNVKPFLEKLLPYLDHKKERARYILMACELMCTRKTACYSDYVKDTIRDLALLIKKANNNDKQVAASNSN